MRASSAGQRRFLFVCQVKVHEAKVGALTSAGEFARQRQAPRPEPAKIFCDGRRP
jgi:hypothetical protein